MLIVIPMSFNNFLEIQYINYIREYRSIILSEGCTSITITKVGRLAGMLPQMFEAISTILYVEQIYCVRQKGLAQITGYISEKPAADG